jgi:hypothetical protein
LLAAVDVVGRAGDRRVGHDVHGEGGDVVRPDHAPDGQCRAELVAALVEVPAEQRRGQRRVDEAGGDEVDPDRRQFDRQVGDQGGQRGGVDLPTSGWDVHNPFGGFRESGSPFKEQGAPAVRFCTRLKTAAVRYAW